MALNNAAADAALNVWIDGLTPALTNDQKQAVRDGMQPLIRAIIACVKDNAVVTVSVTGTASGGSMTGVGNVTAVGSGSLT